MLNLSAGLLAGFVATAVLSAVMVAKAQMGLMPELDVIRMLAEMLGGNVALAWFVHFTIGTVAWGGAYALFFRSIPGDGPVTKGMMLGLIEWGIMMISVMPKSGNGVFGLGIGVAAPAVTLVLHLMFGVVLGLVYQRRAGPIYA